MKVFLKRKYMVPMVFIIGIVAFFFPFFIKPNHDSLIGLLSLSFTAVSAIATIATFIIAILLYDKFGLDGKFMDKQTDKVLELVDLLKGKTITAKVEGFNYFIRPSRHQLSGFIDLKRYQLDCTKRIIVSMDDYNLWAKEILSLRQSYWMPEEIKEKLRDLDFFGFFPIEVLTKDTYVILDFHSGAKGDLYLAFPEKTFEQFNSALHDLVREIEVWLAKHSSITINLKLEESQ